MKTNKILVAAATAMIAWSCAEEKIIDNVTPTPGEDVKFGVALDTESGSRTIYDKETNGAFPIRWLNGDLVKVMSAQCAPDNGIYEVKIPSGTGQAVQAGTLHKKGDAGVQWTDTKTGDFFSIYPSGHVLETTPADRKMKCHLIHTQNDYIRNDNPSTDNHYTALADMNAGFLYSQTFGVDNGATVNLPYKPLSTALRFTLKGPAVGSSTKIDEVIVSDVRIDAPLNIAGDFYVQFPDNAQGVPTISIDNDNAHNNVTVFTSYSSAGTGGYIHLKRGESIELNAFIILAEETPVTNDWTITVTLSNGTKFKKNLGSSTATGNSNVLKPGMIHRLPELPALEIPNNQTDYDPSNWMINIPRNTYLSEISIPGSWNSMNKDFQTVTDLAQQYAKGVRAFHLDCRWKNASNPPLGGSFWTSSGLPGLPKMNDLAIANGSDTYPIHSGSTAISPTIGRVMNARAPTFASALTSITNQVKSDEYMVVVCTYAQGSYDNPNKTWLQAISDACAANGSVYDARNLSPETVVNDVLNSVIVIVNCEGDVSSMTLPSDSKCLFVNAPLTLTSSMFGDGKYNQDIMYSSGTTTASSGVTLFNTQAQVSSNISSGFDTRTRGYAPTLTERENTAASMFTWAANNYKPGQTTYKHNNWMYLGLGGYMTENYAGDAIAGTYNTVASTLNQWIYGRILNMSPTPTGAQTNYYPVGIVLMNFVTDETIYTGSTNNCSAVNTVNEILQLNNKFPKEYDSSKPAWTDNGSGNSDRPVNSASANHASGFNANTDTWTVF